MINILKGWLIFNIFISLYEIYIIKTRHVVKKDYCVRNFWTTPLHLLTFQTPIFTTLKNKKM